MKEERLTIEQALEFCMKMGVKESFRQHESFVKNKRLSNKYQIESLKKSLEMFYEKVEVFGGGKRGYVILTTPKQNPSIRKDDRVNNGGYAVKYENELLLDFFHYNLTSKILSEDGYRETLSSWSSFKWFDQINITEDEWNSCRIVLKSIFTENSSFAERDIDFLLKRFKEEYYRGNRDLTHSFIKKLEKQGKIRVEIEHVHKVNEFVIEMQMEQGIKNPIEFETVSKERHEQVVNSVRKVISSYNIKYSDYKRLSSYPHYAKSDNEKEAIKSANEMLHQNYYIDYYFDTIRIFVIDKTFVRDMSAIDVRDIQCNRLIKLANKRMEKDSYNNIKNLSKRLYRIMLFTVLRNKTKIELCSILEKDIEEVKNEISSFENRLSMEDIHSEISGDLLYEEIVDSYLTESSMLSL